MLGYGLSLNKSKVYPKGYDYKSQEMIDVLEDISYKNLISPSNLFSSKEEVIDFLNIESTVEDLKSFLKACLQEELYEYCLLIKNKLDEKISLN